MLCNCKLVLKISMRPSQWFEFDMPGLEHGQQFSTRVNTLVKFDIFFYVDVHSIISTTKKV